MFREVYLNNYYFRQAVFYEVIAIFEIGRGTQDARLKIGIPAIFLYGCLISEIFCRETAFLSEKWGW